VSFCLQVAPQRVRSWAAHEEWLAFADFSNQLRSPPFLPLLNCDSWQVSALVRRACHLVVAAIASPGLEQLLDLSCCCVCVPLPLQPASQLVFPSSRHKNKAVFAIELGVGEQQRRQLYTFCLEKIEQGPFKNCWVTVGVRVGDYANV
jgi:hypothetical protein